MRAEPIDHRKLRDDGSGASWLEKIALGLLVVITILAVMGPDIAPFDPYLRVGRSYQPPSSRFWLGTDEIGRDLFSRILAGIGLTWLPSLAIIASGVIFGGAVGLVSGAVGGRVDYLLQRVTELFQILPSTLIALATIAALGPGVVHSVIAISLFWWPWYSRLVRAEIRATKALPHAQAAILGDVSQWRLLTRYLLPAAAPVVVVAATLDVANVILILSLFSFLGLGAPAPAPELGAMSARTLENLVDFWWLPVLPAVAIFLIVFCANIAGDRLRRRFEFQ